MDGSRFDILAKAMHTSPSRRRFLGGLAGVAGAALAGRATLEDGLAQTLSASRYDLICRNAGVRSFCFDAEPLTGCGPADLSCRCARLRQGGARVCISQPPGNCPTSRNQCQRNIDCNDPNKVCIIVRNCCPDRPGWGKCVRRCDQ